MTAERLEDVFAGWVELTATQLGFVRGLIAEAYMSGADVPGPNRLTTIRAVSAALFGPLELHRMVTPDGTRLVPVGEHLAIVNAQEKP